MYSFSLLSGISFNEITRDIGTILPGKPSPAGSKAVLHDLFSCMDFTSLEGSDNHASIQSLCEKVISFEKKGLPFPAAVCIFPPFISTAKHVLRGTPVKVATTAAAFPGGQMPMSVKLEEIRYALGEGADEIDVVISRGTFLAREYNTLFRELDTMRDLVGKKMMKVILETGDLQTPENIAKATEIAIEAGADFVVADTGRITPGSTMESAFVILKVIGEYHRKTGKKIGIKPVVGITDPDSALNYYHLGNAVLGKVWLVPELFRIGTSPLADHSILNQT
jgi:deoxyribose-phosphate aldolase